jgi:uncharacterized protein YjbJ (UPF0337 family)
MNSKNEKFDNSKEKFIGESKEVIGKMTGNEQLELHGKLQSAKADFKQKTSVSNNVQKAKEGIAGKINNMIDRRDSIKSAKKTARRRSK